jgi:hypothetical protein
MSGDYQLEDTLYIPFTTRAFATGIPTTLSGGTVTAHRDANLTQFTTGITLSADFDGISGLNMITIVATAANGYVAGETYTLYLSAGTVSSVSVVGEVVGHFTLDMSAAAKDLANATDGLGAIKTETAAILVDTGTTLDGKLNTAQADLDTITDTDGVILGAAGVDLIWDEPLSGHGSGGTTGKALRNAGGVVLATGTADAGAATSIDLETGVADTNDDFYNHTVIIITGGTGAGQERVITDYTGSTQQATVTPAWTVNPDATSEYEIVPGTVHAETQGGGYAGGAVWIGPSGTTGTQLYVDGTVDNPIDDGQMANAKTVADALNLRIFRVEPTSSITLGETLNGYAIEGIEYTLNLGSQDVSNTYISGANLAASTATGSGTIYNNCIFDNAVTLAPCVIRNSYLGDTTITAGSAGNFFINHCVSRAAGASVAPNFDFGAALAASNLNIRDWSGGIELENMGAGIGTYNASIEGQGAVTINANCSATSNLAIRGMFTLTDNAGGAVTVSDDARYEISQVHSADVVQISGSAPAADNLEASALGIISGTAQTGTLSTVTMTTDLTGYADDELIGRTVVWTGGDAAGQASDITDYASASGQVTYTAITTAPANNDTFVIV